MEGLDNGFEKDFLTGFSGRQSVRDGVVNNVGLGILDALFDI